MAALTEPLLMTVEQYRQLPVRDDVRQELHWGQVVTLTRPKMRHTKLQHRLLELLQPLAKSKGVVAVEVPFRALPQYELRGADVAYVSRERWDHTPDDDNLSGSPEIVIEVLSPSNTKQEMREKAALYLSTGAEEFWTVDAKNQTVSVARRDAGVRLYQRGESIPLPLLNGEIAVSAIFQ